MKYLLVACLTAAMPWPFLFCVFPGDWKICSVVHIYKFGDPYAVKNYRPISIIPHIVKIFESLICNRIKRSLNHVIIEEQHGFRPGKSTITSSIVFTTYITECLEQKNQVVVIYTDFRKEFDTVDNGLIINELRAHGVGNPFLTWLKIYLKIDSLESCHILQSELYTFSTWILRLDFSLDLGKYHVMSYTRIRFLIYHPYRLSNVLIELVFVFKDLGIFCSSSLSFEHKHK